MEKQDKTKGPPAGRPLKRTVCLLQGGLGGNGEAVHASVMEHRLNDGEAGAVPILRGELLHILRGVGNLPEERPQHIRK